MKMYALRIVALMYTQKQINKTNIINILNIIEILPE